MGIVECGIAWNWSHRQVDWASARLTVARALAIVQQSGQEDVAISPLMGLEEMEKGRFLSVLAKRALGGEGVNRWQQRDAQLHLYN